MSDHKEPIRVFYSYAHQDAKLLKDLENHLASMRNLGLIDDWHKGKIEAGMDSKAQVDRHLSEARVILLLVSADFLGSSENDAEVVQAIARHDAGSAWVIPVILRPCDWRGAPFSELQVIPKDGKPVTTWENMDQAFDNIVQGVKSVVFRINREKLRGTAEWTPPAPRTVVKQRPGPRTIAITGSMSLPSKQATRRVRDAIAAYLDPSVTWYCGSVGDSDETAATVLFDEAQHLIVVGYGSYDISDKMIDLLEQYRAPFIDAQEEPVFDVDGAPSRRDVLFCSKADLFVLIWDGQSVGTGQLLEWLRGQRKNHLVVYV